MLAISARFLRPATPGAPPSKNANHQDTKRNPATPDGGNDKDIMSKEPNKRVKVVGTQGGNKKEMGMFYLKNAELRATYIFPRDLAQKVCADFTCKGRECIREPCSFLHPRNPREMDKATVKAIPRNFATTKMGWLRDYHFRNETTLPVDVKAMLGGTQGPTQQ